MVLENAVQELPFGLGRRLRIPEVVIGRMDVLHAGSGRPGLELLIPPFAAPVAPVAVDVDLVLGHRLALGIAEV